MQDIVLLLFEKLADFSVALETITVLSVLLINTALVTKSPSVRVSDGR